MLIQRASDIEWNRLEGASTIAITAGASAPEVLVQEVVNALSERFDVTVEERSIRQEDVRFKLPRSLVA